MEDNLHVMATLLRRKVKALDKKEMMIYLSRLMNRNTIEKWLSYYNNKSQSRIIHDHYLWKNFPWASFPELHGYQIFGLRT